MSTPICLPCVGLGCDNPDDLAAGVDTAFYSALDYSFLVACPIGCICPPGLFPQTISILASVIPPVLVPINEGSGQLILRLQTCDGATLTRTLNFDATQSQIQNAAQSLQSEWAGRQAICIAQSTPGVNCNLGNSIQVCNDGSSFLCYGVNFVTIPPGSVCETLNTTGLTPSQIASATAILKAKLNQISKDQVCPFSGIICQLSSQILGGGNGFGLAITNNSGTKSFDCTPITTHHIYNGNIVLDQSGVGSIAPNAVSSPVVGVGGFHGPGSNLLEIRYFGRLIFSFTNNWLGNLQVLWVVNCA